jgi:hypothetical protein
MTAPNHLATSLTGTCWSSPQEEDCLACSPTPHHPSNSSTLSSVAAICLASPGAFYFWERKAAAQLEKTPPQYRFRAALGSAPLVIFPLAVQRYLEACRERKGKETASIPQILGSSAAIAAFSVPFIDTFNKYSGGQRDWKLFTRSPNAACACRIQFFKQRRFASLD